MLNSNKSGTIQHIVSIAVIFVGLYLSSRYNYLLFHSLIELVTVVIGFCVFLITWHARRLLGNDCLKFLGIGYAFVAAIDLLHILAYKGMNIWPGNDANLATQLWIAARYLQAATLCAATIFVDRRVSDRVVGVGYGAVVVVITGLIFSGHFPVCYVEGKGLTVFKIISEYVISGMLLVAFSLFYRRREVFDNKVALFLFSSILCTVGSELAFTAYLTVYGPANMLGHFLKLSGFLFLYKAVIAPAFQKPFDLLLRDFKQKEESLLKVHDVLREKVRESTIELRASEEEYREVFNATSDGIFIHEMDGRLLDTNDAMLKMFGYATKEEALGMSFKEMLSDPPYSMTEAREYLRRATLDGPQMFEWLARKKNGDPFWVEVSLRCCVIGGRKRILSTVRDITERKRAQDALRESEERFSKLFNSCPAPLVVSDLATGQFLDMNEAWAKLIGYTREELLGRSAFELNIYEDNTLRSRIVADLRQKGAVKEQPTRFVTKSGKVRDVLWSTEVIILKGVDCILSLLYDVTERKQAEMELQKLASVVRHSSELVSLATPDGKMIYLNEAGMKMLGIAPDQVLSTHILQVIPEHLKEKVQTEVLAAIRAGSWEGDLEYQNLKTGELIVVHAVIFLVTDAQTGTPLYFANLSLDITERKRAEEELRSTHEQLCNIIESFPDPTFVVDRDKKVIAWNYAIELLTGVPKEQVLGQGDYAYAVPFYGRKQPIMVDFLDVDPGELAAFYTSVKKIGDRVYGESFLPNVYQGRGAYVWGIAVPLYDSRGERWGAIEVIRDITDQVKALKSLRESEERFAKAFHSSPAPMVVSDMATGLFISVNERWSQFIGYTAEEMLGRTSRELNIWADWSVRDGIVARLRRKESVRDVPVRMITKSGAVRETLWYGEVINQEGRELMLSLVYDITERKQAEERLRHLQQQLSDIIEFLPDATFVIDKNKRVIAWNRAVEQMTGVGKKDIIGQNTYSLCFYNELRPILIDIIWEPESKFKVAYPALEIKGNEICGESFVPKAWGGRGAYCWGAASKLFDGEGNLVGAIESVRDISIRKQAEDEIRRSEARYRRLIESTTDYIYTVRVENGRAVETMHGIGCEGVTGYTSEDYRRDPGLWYRMIHEADRKSTVEMAQRALAGQPVSTIEHRIFHKDGVVRWLRDTIVVRKDAQGRVIAYDGLVQDITETRRAEEAIRQSEERYRLLYENMTDSIWTMNFNWKFTFVSQPLSRLLGYSVEELMQIGPASLLTPESRVIAKEVFGKEMLVEKRQGHDSSWSVLKELEYVHKDGRRILCEVKATFLRDSDGNVIGFIGVTRDITDRKAIEKTQRLVQLGKLVADMAHEVNNPLMIISGNAQLSLMAEAKAEEVQEGLRVILEQCDRAKNIIQRLLQFSRPSTGQFRDTDINVCVDSVVELLRYQFSIANVHIQRDYAPGSLLVSADEKQLQEVIVNLLNNAREAMPKGGRIEVKTALVGDFVRIDIKDNGPGMSLETLNKIWEPFFTTKEKGTGLGLPVCFGIIKAHNGDLRCDSSVGGGTTMSIVLPALRRV